MEPFGEASLCPSKIFDFGYIDMGHRLSLATLAVEVTVSLVPFLHSPYEPREESDDEEVHDEDEEDEDGAPMV